MSNDVVVQEKKSPIEKYWTPEQAQIVKRTIAPNLTMDEMVIFAHICQRVQLDPFAKQIYAIKRGGTMCIQTAIDGFRLVAERTGKYSPGDDTQFLKDEKGKLIGAKVYVKKQTADGTWHQISATALLNEYDPGQGLWRKMPSVMIEKCFSEDTEVLTTQGFRKFENVNPGTILQVSEDKLEIVNSAPFSQKYNGDMIEINSQRLNFCVTPNHDMVTTFGKVEAEAMYQTTHNRGPWKIPMNLPFKPEDEPNSDQYKLIGYLLADGSRVSNSSWRIEVSREYKINELMKFEGAYHGIRRCDGSISKSFSRQIRTNFDKSVFTFQTTNLINSLILDDKSLNVEILSKLTPTQSRLIIDAWQLFDGHTNRKTGVRSIYTSHPGHCDAIEVLACMAGYSISTRKNRSSDISSKEGYCYTISNISPVKVLPPISGNPGIIKSPNITDKVWCVTVPSGKIIVRRNGFSMICGNCAEARALRRAFPADLSGLYTAEEMEQADVSPMAPTIEETPKIDPDMANKIEKAVNGYDDIRKGLMQICKVKDIRDIKETQVEACRNYVMAQVKKKKEAENVKDESTE